METPTTPTITSKQILYTILLNSDTETIVEEYILGYLKTHPELHRKYVKENTLPLTTVVVDKMEKQFIEGEPSDTMNPTQRRGYVLKSILSEFAIELSPTQIETISSAFTEKQMVYVNTQVDARPRGWY